MRRWSRVSPFVASEWSFGPVTLPPKHQLTQTRLAENRSSSRGGLPSTRGPVFVVRHTRYPRPSPPAAHSPSRARRTGRHLRFLARFILRLRRRGDVARGWVSRRRLLLNLGPPDLGHDRKRKQLERAGIASRSIRVSHPGFTRLPGRDGTRAGIGDNGRLRRCPDVSFVIHTTYITVTNFAGLPARNSSMVGAFHRTATCTLPRSSQGGMCALKWCCVPKGPLTSTLIVKSEYFSTCIEISMWRNSGNV